VITRPIRFVFCLAALLFLSGCAGLGNDLDNKPPVLGRAGADPVAIQSELMAFTDTFISAISQQWNQAASSAAAAEPADQPATPGTRPIRSAADRARRAALEIKIANVSGALAIATGPNSFVGVADMVTMVTLERMILEDSWTAETFGPTKAALLVSTYKEQEAKAWRMADRAMTPAQQDQLRTLITTWRKENPNQRYIAGVRLEDFAVARGDVTSTEDFTPGSLLALVGLDPLANLDPTIREVQRSRLLAERIFFYTQHAAPVIKWQTESLYTGMLQTPEVRSAIAAIVQASDAADNMADAADHLRVDLAKERHDALNDLFAQLKTERTDAIAQLDDTLRRQREALLNDIDTKQEGMRSTLKEFRETVKASESLSDSLRSTIKEADTLATKLVPTADPNSPKTPRDPNRPDALTEYRLAVEQTAQTAEKLTVLAERLDKLLQSPQLDAKAGNLRSVVESVQGGVNQSVNRAFWWLLILALISAACFGAALMAALSAHKAYERRSASRRRELRRRVPPAHPEKFRD
jgi:hypothetical protein